MQPSRDRNIRHVRVAVGSGEISCFVTRIWDLTISDGEGECAAKILPGRSEGNTRSKH